MKLNPLKKLFEPTPEFTSTGELRLGRVVLRGRALAGPEVLHSPIHGKTCLAFFYRATYQVPSRGSWIRRLFRQAEVYSPMFYLELEDGRVVVVPRKTDQMSAEDHHEIRARNLHGLEAAEQLICSGDHVRINGKLLARGDGMVLEPRSIELLPPLPKKRPKRRTGRRRDRRKERAGRG